MKLAEWLKQNHPLSDHLRVMDGLLSALGEGDLRREGPISLDPAAIEVSSDGRCSLARARPSAAYQAPEVLGGASPSPKAHTYSVGVVFYRMLTGKHPFGAEPGAAGVPDAAEEPAHLSEARPDLPRDLADAIMACLERDPDWRPKDLSYLSELVHALGGSPAPSARASAKPARAPARMDEAAPPPRSRLVFFAIAAAAVLTAGAAALYWTRTPPPGALEGGARPARPGAPRGEAQAPSPEPSAPAVVPSRAPEEGSRPGPRPGPPQASPLLASPPQASYAQPSPPPPAPPVAESRDAAAPPPALKPRPAATPEALHPKPEAPPTPPSTAHPATPSIPVSTPPPIPVSTPPPAAAPGAPAAAPGAALAAPAVLSTLSPATLRRSSTEMVEVRGTGLRPELRAAIYKGREPAPGIIVVRQKFVGESLIQVVVRIDEAVEPGVYSLAFSDTEGHVTNARPIRVVR